MSGAAPEAPSVAPGSGRSRALARADDEWAVVVVLVAKVLTLLFGAVYFQVAQNAALTSPSDVFEIWNRWDGPHYLDVARYGYRASGELRFFLVFFPLFPALVRLVMVVVPNALASAFVVSTVASVAAAVAFVRLVALDYAPRLARSTLWLMLIFPTAYFLHIGYTESLFLALTLGSFLAARRERWMRAGVLGALAGATRIGGILLLPALAAEALVGGGARRLGARWLWLGLIPLGLGAYLSINYAVTGDALAFMTLQREHWGVTLATPWDGIRTTIESIGWREPAQSQMVGSQVLLFLALGLAGTLASLFVLRASYAVWMAANWLLFACQSFDLSTPRYMLAMFPLFILIAMVSANRYMNVLVTVWSLLFMGLFAGQFVQGRWAF